MGACQDKDDPTILVFPTISIINSIIYHLKTLSEVSGYQLITISILTAPLKTIRNKEKTLHRYTKVNWRTMPTNNRY